MHYIFRRPLLLSLGGALVLLLLISEAVFALPVRFLSWEPERLAPHSIAPGEEATHTVTFTPAFPVPKGRNLTAVLTGAARELVTGVVVDFSPGFRYTISGGSAVPVRLSVRIPPGATVGSYPGTLTLRYGEGGMPLLFAPDLSVDLTVSTIPVPPDPGKRGKETVAGIDSNGNGVRDDVERFIVFSHPDRTPEQENTRNALFQYARAAQEGLLVAGDREAARAAGEEVQDAVECLWFVMDGDIELASRVRAEVTARTLNTLARTKAQSRYNSQLSGKIFNLDSGDFSVENCVFEAL